MSTRPETAEYTAPVNESDGDLMTVQEYLDSGFRDYDGHGDVVKDGKIAEAQFDEATGWPRWIKPSEGDRYIPLDATHILWYNR